MPSRPRPRYTHFPRLRGLRGDDDWSGQSDASYDAEENRGLQLILPPGFSVMTDCGESENWEDAQGNVHGGYQHGCETWYFFSGIRFVEARYPPSQAGELARFYIPAGPGHWLVPYEVANAIGAGKDGFLDSFMVGLPVRLAAMFVTAGITGGLDQFSTPEVWGGGAPSPLVNFNSPLSPPVQKTLTDQGVKVATGEVVKASNTGTGSTGGSIRNPLPFNPASDPFWGGCGPTMYCVQPGHGDAVNLPQPLPDDTIKWLLTAVGIALSFAH